MLNAVKGYELDLVSTPYQCLLPKELTLILGRRLSDLEIEKIEQKGAICIAVENTPGFYSQLLKKSGAII